VIDGRVPFVVTAIVQCEPASPSGVSNNKSDKLSIYYSSFKNGYEGYFFQRRPKIILPTGIFNIGDTITTNIFIKTK